jgi:hypothetical protein
MLRRGRLLSLRRVERRIKGPDFRPALEKHAGDQVAD